MDNEKKVNLSNLDIERNTIKNEVIEKLQRLFVFYCQYGDRLNTENFGIHKFSKLMIESGIIDKNLNKIRLELIFKSESKKNIMDFKMFLNSLVKVAEFKYGKQTNKNQALNMLLKDYMMQLYHKIYDVEDQETSKLEMDRDMRDNRRNLNKSSSQLLISQSDNGLYDKIIEEIFTYSSHSLYHVFRVYFPHELSLCENKNYLKDESSKSYFTFVKDFDLCAGLVSKPAAYQIWLSETNEESDQAIANNQEFYFKFLKNAELESILRVNSKNSNILGQFFNFFKFLRCIFKISQQGYAKANLPQDQNESRDSNFINKITPMEKLIYTLERMEMSDGFLNIEKKTFKTHTTNYSVILTKELLERLKLNNDQSNTNFNPGSHHNHDIMINGKSVIHHNNYREICDMSSYIMETYGDQLSLIYKGFCSFGDPFNTKFMKSKKFTKLLLEAQLISPYYDKHNKTTIQMNEIDVIFIKLSQLSENQNLNNTNIYNNNETMHHGCFTHHASTNNMMSYQSILSENNSETKNKLMKTKSTKIINSNAKIDFDTFIIAIEVIARFIFPGANPKESVDYIIKEHILKNISPLIIERIRQVEEKLESLKSKDEEFFNLLGLLDTSFGLIYPYYCDNKGFINFNQFIK